MQFSIEKSIQKVSFYAFIWTTKIPHTLTKNIIALARLTHTYRWVGWIDSFWVRWNHILAIKSLNKSHANAFRWKEKIQFGFKHEWTLHYFCQSAFIGNICMLTYFDGVFIWTSHICMIAAQCADGICCWATCLCSCNACSQKEYLLKK